MDAPRSRRTLLDGAARRLSTAGVETARLDAELLLAAASGRTRTALLASAQALTERDCERFETMLKRRALREPLAYITGRKEFYSLDFEVTPAVLIPRPETELLVAIALHWLRTRPQARVLDLGTGSGAAALAVAANAASATLVATDYSADAIEVAHRNVARVGLTDRVELRRADWFAIADGGPALGRFDLILSNPPYIPTVEIASCAPEVAGWEPRAALDGGPDGLDAYRAIARDAPAHLTVTGALLLEVGFGQAAAVSALLRAAGFRQIEVARDLGGVERVVSGVADTLDQTIA